MPDENDLLMPPDDSIHVLRAGSPRVEGGRA
jgi:hypothetical protein